MSEQTELRVFGKLEHIEKIINHLKEKFGEDYVYVSGPYKNTRPPRLEDHRAYVFIKMKEPTEDGK